MLFSDPFCQAFLVELVVFTLHVIEVDQVGDWLHANDAFFEKIQFY